MTNRFDSLRLHVLALAVAVLSVRVASSARSDAAPSSDNIVVLMSIDGLANFYIDDPAAEIPTLRKLAAEGAKAASMRASDPTVTWPNHTTLVTGVSPGVHGVLGNNYFDRVSGEKVTLIWDPTFDKDEVVKVPTIYDVAKSAGLTTAAIRWPATRGATTIDWNSPDLGEDKLILKYTTPELFEECKKCNLKLLQTEDATGKIGKQSREECTAADQIWTDVFKLVLREHRPNLALHHIISVDHTEHAEGPRSEEAYKAIKDADDQVRQVWDQLQRDFPGKATLIVVSDHGFSANKIEVRPNVILKEKGLVDVDGKKAIGGKVQVLPQGGSAMVYILDDANRDSIVQQIKAAFTSVEGVSGVVSADEFPEYGLADPRRDPRSPDMMLFAKMGYFFGDTAAGSIPHDTKPERKGSHGHDSRFADLHAMFIACGAGIKPDVQLGEIDNRSVAPTIAKLLGIEMPGIEGKVLSEALAN